MKQARWGRPAVDGVPPPPPLPSGEALLPNGPPTLPSSPPASAP